VTDIVHLTDLQVLRQSEGDLRSGLNLSSLDRETRDSSEAGAIPREGVISIGNFDGVHRGHAALLRRVRTLADRLGGPAVAVVLDPHPAVILRPDRAPERLSWIECRAERMAACGIDLLVVCPTSRDFLSMSAEEFFHALVLDRLAARAIVEGPNFFFGRGRAGSVDTLKKLCAEHGVLAKIVDANDVGGEMISSTRIRELLLHGDVETAASLLGYPHRVRGRVVEGSRRGRTIGFPTANLDDVDGMLPCPGVYAGTADLESGRTLAAAIHLGKNPTFESDGKPKLEIHLLDFDGDLYGTSLQVDFVCRVRDIARFESADQLASQLRQDIQTVRSKRLPANRD